MPKWDLSLKGNLSNSSDETSSGFIIGIGIAGIIVIFSLAFCNNHSQINENICVDTIYQIGSNNGKYICHPTATVNINVNQNLIECKCKKDKIEK